MEWKSLEKKQAAIEVGEWQNIDHDSFQTFVETWPQTIQNTLDDDYKQLRDEVVGAFAQISEKVKNDPVMRNKADYNIDLLFGIQFYSILDKYGFNQRYASNNEVWIYLCMKVFPDIVYKRYPGKKQGKGPNTVFLNVNDDRLYKTSRRIYLKVLWWYIYLSLQDGDTLEEQLDETYLILKNNTTDTVVQIVERSGTEGYRVDVYREILRYFADISDTDRGNILRKVMVLNTTWTVYMEPDLYEGGVKNYVKELFNHFGK